MIYSLFLSADYKETGLREKQNKIEETKVTF